MKRLTKDLKGVAQKMIWKTGIILIIYRALIVTLKVDNTQNVKGQLYYESML